MGQSPSDHPNTNNQELFEKLSFILAEQNPHYGELLIYRLTQKPYDYYLRYNQQHAGIERPIKIIRTPRLISNVPSVSTLLCRGTETLSKLT